MVRNIPTGDDPWNIDPVLSLSLLVASISATIAIVSSLCGSLTRKKNPPNQPTDDQRKANENNPEVVISPTNDPNAPTTELSDHQKPNNFTSEPPLLNEDGVPQLLPPPPGMAHLRAASYHIRSSSNASHGKSTHGKGLASSMSMKVHGGGLLGSRQMSKRDQDHNDKKKDKKLKHEDSIWKKTIILGEKCKVPEDEEDAIVYDEKGKQIPTYHKKAQSSLTLSRQSSNIDQEAVPSSREKENLA